MEFDITKVVYVKSNGELSNNVDLSMVGFIADSIATLQKLDGSPCGVLVKE